MVTSYCPDGVLATDLLAESARCTTVFYDMDTPVTLENLQAGREVAYIGPRGLRDFDLVLSYTGGKSLAQLRDLLGARDVRPLYGHVDPDVHHPVPRVPAYEGSLSYMGTYAADRQAALQALFVEPAAKLPHQWFVIGGAQYPADFPWAANMRFVQHLPPAEHPAFFASSRFTLNVTRAAMARNGYCPSGRLFEAAACGTPVLSDAWPGLDEFFAPAREIVLARDAGDVVAALELTDAEVRRIARAARERVLAQHTSDHRAAELVAAVEQVGTAQAAAA
jgi:spore maturation protein CgeB